MGVFNKVEYPPYRGLFNFCEYDMGRIHAVFTNTMVFISSLVSAIPPLRSPAPRNCHYATRIGVHLRAGAGMGEAQQGQRTPLPCLVCSTGCLVTGWLYMPSKSRAAPRDSHYATRTGVHLRAVVWVRRNGGQRTPRCVQLAGRFPEPAAGHSLRSQ